jgi:short-subunit dehydrogenase involved in D-alanine esterification of teichoic acids
MKLTGNTILISGGTAGIGLKLAEAMLELENNVIVLGRNQKKLLELKKQGFEIISCDMSLQHEIEEASVQIQNQYPRLNMLFNNAGIQYNYDFTEHVIPLDRISQEIQVNVTGQIILTQLLIPLLTNNKNSYIINTTSGLGAFPKYDGLVYSSGKAAMRNFTTGLRYSLKKKSIRVLEFIPPVTDTAMTRKRDEQKMPVEKLIRQIIPQLRKDKNILTIPGMRVFLWIAFFFPSLANKILSKS